MRNRVKPKSLVWITAIVLLSSILVYLFAFIYEKPGGISDRRLSQTMGLNGTIRIPIGKTPEDALQRFRDNQSSHIIHRESLDGGMLLFLKRFNQDESTHLQVEYIRKTWLGWKWVWGGGFSIGGPLQSESILNYMSIPDYEYASSPFPILFGDVLDPSIQRITVATNSKQKRSAKLVEVHSGKTIWFAILPSSATTPYEVKGFNNEGILIANKTIQDPRDSGTIDYQN